MLKFLIMNFKKGIMNKFKNKDIFKVIRYLNYIFLYIISAFILFGFFYNHFFNNDSFVSVTFYGVITFFYLIINNKKILDMPEKELYKIFILDFNSKILQHNFLSFLLFIFCLVNFNNDYRERELSFSDKNHSNTIQKTKSPEEIQEEDDYFCHKNIEYYLQDSNILKDPSSYESISFGKTIKEKNKRLILHTFRAKNSFNAFVRETYLFTLNDEREVISAVKF